jgi:ribonuclease P protein subunit RPR2
MQKRGLRILVVDDDERLRVLLRTTFELVETVVEEVGDAEAARLAIARSAPDVVVLDVHLPGTDGVEFTRELKQDERTSAIGIVLLTGGTLENEAGEEAGASAVIRKPFSPLDLLAAVERAADAPRTPLLTEAASVQRDDQLLLYAGDVRRLLEVERRHRQALERLYRETLGALTIALESRDSGTGQHSMRVQRYALHLTRACVPELLDDPSVELGYLLHDIGKVAIPDVILQKPGPLTNPERRVMEQHSTVGAEILSGVGLLEGNGVRVVRHHHERWDGEGYPDGLGEDEIPLPARIFAVADTLDAITSDRPYRKAQPWEAAVIQIRGGAGTQFDPEIVDTFRDCEPMLRALAVA